MRVNLSWLTTDDLDLHIVTPNGEICYNNKSVEHEGVIGVLDIDANAGNNLVSNPQENINFDVMPKGKHTIFVNFYADREGKSQVPFTIWIDNGDDSKIYDDFIKKSDGKKEIVYFQYENGISEFTLPNTSY